MSELDVRIVRLEPLHVACAHGFGPNPEERAWKALLTWAEQKDLLRDGQAHRFFGFNNPGPTPGSPNYGYDQWMTVGPQVQGEGEIHVLDLPGGLYAVARCTLGNIGEAWQQLATWRETSRYRYGNHPCLEESIDPLNGAAIGAPDAVMDLYMPIAE